VPITAQIIPTTAHIDWSSLINERIANIKASGTSIMLNTNILINPKIKLTIPNVGVGPCTIIIFVFSSVIKNILYPFL
jgi:hypothetical protein